jgi:hypothetical protein
MGRFCTAFAVLLSWSSAHAASSLCDLLTIDEVSKALGKSVQAGRAASPLDSGCQWGDDDASVEVQVVPRDYWEVPRLADGYRRLSGIGTAAYVVPQSTGWRAGGLSDQAVFVTVYGNTATAEVTVTLLGRVIGRLGNKVE